MLCSVRRGPADYAYYDSPREPAPSWGRSLGGLGQPLVSALPALPAGARMTGTGRVARGVLCRPGSSFSLAGLGALDASGLGLLVPVGLLALYVWLKERG